MSLPEELAKKYAKGICSECRGNPFAIKQAVDEAIERCALEIYGTRGISIEAAVKAADRIRALKSGGNYGE